MRTTTMDWQLLDRDREIFETELATFVPPRVFDSHLHLYELSHFNGSPPGLCAKGPPSAGWNEFQRRIAESAARQQWEIEQRRKVVVGVNEFVTADPELSIPVLRVGEEVDRSQRARLAALRRDRDQVLLTERLDALRNAARTDANLIPFILDCARAYGTLYEIRHAMEEVFGAYREPVFF